MFGDADNWRQNEATIFEHFKLKILACINACFDREGDSFARVNVQQSGGHSGLSVSERL